MERVPLKSLAATVSTAAFCVDGSKSWRFPAFVTVEITDVAVSVERPVS